MSRPLVFIPTYNERDNVEPMCRQILAAADVDILFVDDDSPDGTGEILDRLATQPRVHVEHRSAKQGIGSAHMHGIAIAYERGYSQLVTMDCDFTHSPALIPSLLSKGDAFDLVIGSRYAQAGGLSNWSMLRRGLTYGGHFLTTMLLGISEDATSAFRLYDLRRIPREAFHAITSPGYAFFFESLLVLKECGVRIGELPATLAARTHGESKMDLAEVRRSVTTLLTLYAARKRTAQRARRATARSGSDRPGDQSGRSNRFSSTAT